MGNLALPCYIMAKKMHKNPLQIASELAEKLNEQKDELGIEKAENVGVYCNIYLKRDLIVKKCFEVLEIARLLLTDLVQKILCEACELLGMECPDEM